uniref:Uncharacterized protein n=1 Tax=Echeneis naucrates TaxID=173247 RepID=A0A665X8F4_ECHNA
VLPTAGTKGPQRVKSTQSIPPLACFPGTEGTFEQGRETVRYSGQTQDGLLNLSQPKENSIGRDVQPQIGFARFTGASAGSGGETK